MHITQHELNRLAAAVTAVIIDQWPTFRRLTDRQPAKRVIPTDAWYI
jgi:hypothetical protein